MQDVRASIIRGIKAIPDVEVDDDAVDKIAKKVIAYSPRNIGNYAFRAGKNWSLDKRRSLSHAPALEVRRLRKENAELMKRIEELEYQREKAMHLVEFERVTARLIRMIKPSQVQQLNVVHARVFEDRLATELCVERRVSHDLIDQMKRRGVKLIWPHISEGFREFLGCKAP